MFRFDGVHMATTHAAPRAKSVLARVLTTDFCPWANRFVYWLKEPVGWFALATAMSVMIGMYLAPIGWIIAASLSALIVVGMAWPWIAVRAAAFALQPANNRVQEGDACYLVLDIRNRLPLPLWGLAVEGFLDCDQVDSELESVPTVALAYVRAWSTCRYRFALHPQLRGRYPTTTTYVACSFPFGIWTARRPLEDVSPITVWPKIYPIFDHLEESGRCMTAVGDGDRRGGTNDFIGLRDYQLGDAFKHVNWIATARSDRLMVTERGAPQSPAWEVVVDDRGGRSRDEIADQVRVAASVLANLHDQGVLFRVQIGTRRFAVQRGHEGFVRMMDALAEIPADGVERRQPSRADVNGASITLSTNVDGDITVRLVNPDTNHRLLKSHRHRVIGRSSPLSKRLETLWSQEHGHECVA